MPIENIYFGGPKILETKETSTVKTTGGVLYLTKDSELLSSQLESGALNPIDDNQLKDDISTDAIIRVTDLIQKNTKDLARYALKGMNGNSGFSDNTLQNSGKTVLVAGERFGSGSSREQAVWALQEAGITAVLAQSFGPIFEKNAIYNGLLTSNDVELARSIQNGELLPFSHFLESKPLLMQDILRCGGLFNYLREVKSGKIKNPNLSYKDRETGHPMNIWEQRLAQATGIHSVQKEDTIIIPVDTAYSYDVLSVPAFQLLLKEYGAVTSNIDVNNLYLFEDHFAYSLDNRIPQLVELQRQFANSLGLDSSHYHKGKVEEGGGKGICHRVMLEKLDPRINKVVLCTDSHTPTIGALPILGLPVGSTLFAAALAEGEIPISVNGVLRVELTNQIPKGLSIRDVQLNLARIAKDIPSGLVVEFGGQGINTLSFEQVAALCNMVPEVFTAELAVTEAYEAGIQFLGKHGIDRETAIKMYGTSDPNCSYEHTLKYDLSSTTPVISLPGSPKNVVPLSEFDQQTKIDKAFLVSCTLGLRDLAEAAAMIKDKKVSDGVQLIVTPSSSIVREQAEALGILTILQEAGAYITDGSACGACIGEGLGSLNQDEVAITSSNRNFPGRMGALNSKAFMGSPQLTTLSSTLGHIPNVEEWQKELELFNENMAIFDEEISRRYPAVGIPIQTS